MRKIIFLIIAFFLAGCASKRTINIDMVFVKGGTFAMGCVEREDDPYFCSLHSSIVHDVTLNDFYISKYLVTQKLWKEVMGEGSSKWQYGEGDDYPVYYVSWNKAQEFIEKLNSMTGKKYRFPTEAEWEYAARGGAKSKGYKYAGSNNYDEVAWHRRNSGDSILEMNFSGRAVFMSPQPVRDKEEEKNNNGVRPVGKKKPNELGIYDMSGNVDEWVWDWNDEDSSAPQINPKGPSSGYRRVIRGGNWNGLETSVYWSGAYWPNIHTSDMAGIGFRLAMDN
jgi:formylglycine-generating enzyme required for sulfatase activity